MQRVLATLAVLVSVSCAGTSGTDSALEAARSEWRELCASEDCRADLRVSIVDDEGQTITFDAPEAQPIVQGGVINLYPGEAYCFSGRAQEGAVADLEMVAEAEGPDRLCFSFSQEPSVRQGADMLLRVRSSFEAPVKFRLGMLLPYREELGIQGTSSCPVFPGATATEHWPHAIVTLFIADAILLDPEAPLVCN